MIADRPHEKSPTLAAMYIADAIKVKEDARTRKKVTQEISSAQVNKSVKELRILKTKEVRKFIHGIDCEKKKMYKMIQKELIEKELEEKLNAIMERYMIRLTRNYTVQKN